MKALNDLLGTFFGALRTRPGTRVIVVGVVASFLVPMICRAGLVTNYAALVLGTGIALAAAALSLNLLMGYAGQISLGQYSLLGVGAFVSGALTPASAASAGLPFVVALPAAALAGAGAAFLVGLPALRLRGLYLAVVTIAMSFALTESIFRAESIGGGSAGIALPRPQVNDFIFTQNGDYLGILIALLAVIWWFDTNVTRTTLGRAFRAIKSDESVAASFGVDVTRFKLGAFALAGAVAGIAGLMYGHLVGTVNSESFQYEKSLLLVVVVVVGGLGSRVGVLFAASFYALYPVVMPTIFGDSILGYDLVIGAAFLIFTMARNPGGLAGTMRELLHERRVKASEGTIGGVSSVMPKLPALPKPSGLHERAVGDGPVLSCSDIRVHFGGLVAVDDASLSVPRGKIVGLIGPNGAGKTTLFNVLSGERKPDSGMVELLGQDVSTRNAAQRAAAGLGRTFQHIGLVRDLSVTENFLLAQHCVSGYDPFSALAYLPAVAKGEKELRERAEAALAALGFERYADTPVGNLSIGQQRIVELSSALLTAPEVVLLDEPAAGMAPAAAESLAERLLDLRNELGRTVLLIEHNIPLVMATCDEVYVLSAGRVIAHGTPDEIARDDLVLEAYLGGAVL
jgi:ABC-type branched-subunit amino acid transport system ATPase component/ABC-type branched-subunit amino acid transport system permease subunit